MSVNNCIKIEYKAKYVLWEGFSSIDNLFELYYPTTSSTSETTTGTTSGTTGTTGTTTGGTTTSGSTSDSTSETTSSIIDFTMNKEGTIIIKTGPFKTEDITSVTANKGDYIIKTNTEQSYVEVITKEDFEETFVKTR
jgi:hypothetical protein